MRYRVNHADDRLKIKINGHVVADTKYEGLSKWHHVSLKNLQLADYRGLLKIIEIELYNKRSFRGGVLGELQGKREGWSYSIDIIFPDKSIHTFKGKRKQWNPRSGIPEMV